MKRHFEKNTTINKPAQKEQQKESEVALMDMLKNVGYFDTNDTTMMVK